MITMEMCKKHDERVKPKSYDPKKVESGSLHMDIKNLAYLGKFITEIGEIVGMNKSTVYDCLKRLGINKHSFGSANRKPGNRTNHPRRKIKPVYSLFTCQSCGEIIVHFRDMCNWCRGKNATQIHETDNPVS